MGRTAKENLNLPRIYDFTDYREFLKAWFEAKKQTGRGMSFRNFSQRCGLKSSNFLFLVMKGERNLTEDSLIAVAKGLDFTKQETDFFRNLVYFNQARDFEARNHYYSELIRFKPFQEVKPLARHQYSYASKWYHAAIRELLPTVQTSDPAGEISKKLMPAVTKEEVEQSIELLLELKLVEKNKDGKFTIRQGVVTTGSEVQSVVISNYHANMLDLCKRAITEIPADRRDISALTLGVQESLIPEIKKRVQEFRKEILRLVEGDSKPETVVQLNFQLIPLTQVNKQ